MSGDPRAAWSFVAILWEKKKKHEEAKRLGTNQTGIRNRERRREKEREGKTAGGIRKREGEKREVRKGERLRAVTQPAMKQSPLETLE